MPSVSVIVPVYKVEKYINRCVNSLINQTLKELEIILVDDGSTDHSSEICEEWQKKDHRIKVIHKINGGLSSARNAGLKIAAGDYVGFVDSDDDVEIIMYERLLKTIQQYDVDYVMADYLRISCDGVKRAVTKDIEGGLYRKERIKKEIFPQLIMGENLDYGPCLSVCMAVYRKAFLDNYCLRFDEEVRWSEDNIFSAIATYQCSSFYYLKGEYLYHYHNNPGTITTSYREGAWEVYCKMNKNLHNFFDEVAEYDFSQQLKLHLLYYACNSIGNINRSPLSKKRKSEERRKLLKSKQLVSAFREFVWPNWPLKLKIQVLAIKMKANWFAAIR